VTGAVATGAAARATPSGFTDAAAGVTGSTQIVAAVDTASRLSRLRRARTRRATGPSRLIRRDIRFPRVRGIADQQRFAFSPDEIDGVHYQVDSGVHAPLNSYRTDTVK